MVQSVRNPCSTTLVLVAVVLVAGLIQPGIGRTPGRKAQPPAGLAPAANETLTYDHVHLGVPDPAKAVEWYAKYMGGQPGPAGEPNERLLFRKIRFIFLKNDKPLPRSRSSIDHIGLSFAVLAAKMEAVDMAGYHGHRRAARGAQSQGLEVYNRAQARAGHPHLICRRSGGGKD